MGAPLFRSPALAFGLVMPSPGLPVPPTFSDAHHDESGLEKLFEDDPTPAFGIISPAAEWKSNDFPSYHSDSGESGCSSSSLSDYPEF